MSHWVFAVIGIPFAAAAILALLPGYRLTAALNVLASALTLIAGFNLLAAPGSVDHYLIVDEVNIVFILLNTLVGFTAAWFSASYIGHEIETGRVTPRAVRFYHAMYQAMLGAMNVALLANNIGLLWVGLELATLITVVMVGLYRTPEAIEAAWKYFILGSVGISLAFFGTILAYLAGQQALGEGPPAMAWNLLYANATKLDVSLLNLAFVFLLVGYGTKVGLAPLHAWLPDAHSEGPTPISAVLSGLLLNVALYALLRFKMLIAANPLALRPGPVLIVMGLVSLIFAALMLYRRRDIKRLFAYSFAFARAVEAAVGIDVPPRAITLRAIMAELERIAHHINDFGAICNDASVVALHAHCTLLREKILAACDHVFGHRLMMDRIVPGGVVADIGAAALNDLRRLLDTCEHDFQQAVYHYEESPSIQDRTVTTGTVDSALVVQFGAGGFIGRASGRAFDSRRDAAYRPYDSLKFDVPVRQEGDVNARAWIRIDEVAQSISMLRQLLDRLRPGPVSVELPTSIKGEGAALVEAFRGDVFVAVRLNGGGTIGHCHARDASCFQWPLLEAAIDGNIVADFPLCNKSFNCSYSGHDM